MDPSRFLLDYSMMSNATFKQMLLDDPSINLLDEFLNDEEKLTFTRQYVQLVNKLNYFKLQDEQWTYYYQLGINEGIWTGRVSKQMAQLNSMPSTYGRRKLLIEQRRKYFQAQLTDITSQLQEHKEKVPCNMDINKLMTILDDFINRDQYQLRLEFERRRHILKYDAKDHQLVDTFYKLKPRKTEVCKTYSILLSGVYSSIYLDSLSKKYLENYSRRTRAKIRSCYV